MTGRRIHCQVPFCKRTRGDRKNDPLPNNGSAYEWLCGDHWKFVDRRTKRLIRRCDKIGKPGLASWLWHKRAKPQAIERAMGIG